jgi:glycosyltransferase involved in cell wall biosynthesis
MAGMRVAVVHDKLVQLGGAERVAREMLEVWPGANLYTSAFDPELAKSAGFGQVRSTFLQRLPLSPDGTRWLLPLYDRAFRSLDLSDFDLVVSSSAMFAKSVRTNGTPHICYCHTPIVYLWHLRESHMRELPYPLPVRAAASATVPWLRRLDRRAAAGVDVFIANSEAVAGRIRRYYGRDAEVIHPPVDLTPFCTDHEREDYLLVVARLFPYKRVDLAIEAANRLGVRLKIVGDGSDRPRLEAMAGDTIEFVGWADDAAKAKLFGAARALLVPQEEDFGMVMVEALASGTPVVAFREGGALEIIEEGATGVFFDRQTPEDLIAAIGRLESFELDRQAMRERADEFSPERFDAAMRDVADRVLGRPSAAYAMAAR